MFDWRGNVAGGLFTILGTAVLVAVLVPFRADLGLHNVGFLLLLWTLLVAATWGRTVGFYAAIVTNLALNFFFIEPLHRFTVEEPRNIVALAVFLSVSLVAGTLLSSARRAAAEARQGQAEAEVALTLSRALGGHTHPEQALVALCQVVAQAFDAPGAAVLTRADGTWRVIAHAGQAEAARPPSPEERAAAERAVSERTLQGLGSTGLTGGRARVVFPRGRDAAYRRDQAAALVPLQLEERTLGVLRLDGPIGNTPFKEEPERLLAAVASEAAVAVQRADLAREAAHAAALREADAMKTALMASISHDLKTPLAGIKAAISSLMDSSLNWSPEDIEAFHRTIDSQADRLNRVISDILDLNRIESGSLTPDQTPLSVIDVLQRARDATSFESTGREVTVESPTELRALADESLIMQAVVNLIENAIKYSKRTGAIHLRGEDHGTHVTITVADEGPGIAPADLPYIFERFYRAEESSRRVKGSGLGLTIVKAFVELSGGSVDVASSPEGTRFEIRLPSAKEQVPA